MNACFSINGKVIETERLILRAFTQHDLDDFFEYASVEGVGEMAGWRHHKNKCESQEILNSFIENDKTFAICLKENGKVIGSIGVERYRNEEILTEFNGYLGRELGYALSKEYWGKGLMPEAVKSVINYLFNDLNLDFITCGYFLTNEQSGRVNEKCGFLPYRRYFVETRFGTREETTFNVLLNPNKNINLDFSNSDKFIN